MGRRSPLARAPRPTAPGRHQVHFDSSVKAVDRAPIVVATDASVAAGKVGTGYLATTGETGLRAHLYPQYLTTPRVRLVVSELRAVYWGLRRVLAAHPGRPVEVRVDNLDALDLLHQWQKGGDRMPDGYETRLRSRGRKASLVKLQMYAEYTPGLTFVHEKAHVGNPLNEAADSLAKLGLRSLNGMVPATEIPRLVPLWAGGALAEYQRGRSRG
ncbi:hypothetical protein ACWELO_10845 [Streptomyces sp. NPDC004596]